LSLSSPPELAEGPLPPPRDRGAVERQLVAKKLLAAKQLIIGVLEPARAQDLVGEIVHRLQDREPCHQPRGQRRMPAPVAISGAELVLQKAPIDQPPELRQRVVHVHDLIEPRLEHVVLPASPLVHRTHLEASKPVGSEDGITPSWRKKLQDFAYPQPRNWQKNKLEYTSE